MSHSDQLAPVSRSERIDAMDILRGFALVGILLMNVEWFSRSISELGGFDRDLTGLDHAVGWLVRCFVEGKFYKLFALLFGMGFAIMLIRAKEADKPFNAWFARRMLVLFAIGMLHIIFLWGGDILHDYAFAGLLLIGFMALLKRPRLQRFDNPRSLLKLGLVWLMLPFVIAMFAGIGFSTVFNYDKLSQRWENDQRIVEIVTARMAEPVEDAVTEEGAEAVEDAAPEQDMEAAQDAAAEQDLEAVDEETVAAGESPLEAEATDELADEDRELSDEEKIEEAANEIVERRRENMANQKLDDEVFSSESWWNVTKHRLKFSGQMLMMTPVFALIMLLPIFLIGYWFIASGTLKNHRQNHHIFKPMAIIGLGLGLALNVAALMILQHPVARISISLIATGQILFGLGQFVLSAGYLGAVVMLLGSDKWAGRMTWLAPIGRMALTNYIMHSVILTTLFYGYAGGLYGQITRAPQMLIVIAIVLFQVAFSTWWLSRYRFGPLEWLWRSLTYKELQPMRITSQP